MAETIDSLRKKNTKTGNFKEIAAFVDHDSMLSGALRELQDLYAVINNEKLAALRQIDDRYASHRCAAETKYSLILKMMS